MNFLNVHIIDIFPVFNIWRLNEHGTLSKQGQHLCILSANHKWLILFKAALSSHWDEYGRSLCLERFHFENERSSKKPHEFKQGNNTLNLFLMRSFSYAVPVH